MNLRHSTWLVLLSEVNRYDLGRSLTHAFTQVDLPVGIAIIAILLPTL